MANVVAQPQTSRAGLITTLVVFIVLTILMSVLFFKQSSETQKAQKSLEDTNRKYLDVIADASITGPDFTAAKEQYKQAGSLSAFDLVATQRNDLETAVTGAPGDYTAIRQRADVAKDKSNADLKTLSSKVSMTVAPGSNLIDTLAKWPSLVSAAIDQRDQAKKDVAAAQDKIKQMDAANAQALAEKDKAIADAKAETAKANDQVAQLQQAQTAALANVQSGANQSIQNLTQQLTAVQGVVAQKDQAYAAINKRMTGLLSALRRFKANNSIKEDIIRVPDGEIKTVAGSDCFINLGRGDQIAVGMTFEVYDAGKGIPALGDGTSTDEPVRRTGGSSAAALAGKASSASNDKFQYELPKGKGSIEVINVGPDHTSQCRIVHVEPGETISQGDIIANLVYDRNIKYNFVVYGDFDLANSNASVRANDAPVIRRLIEQWGGHVQPITDAAHPAESVTPETDFVIVGKEPVIPNFSPEELNDPANQLIAEKAKAKQEAYRAVLGKAADYGIPVMNQNRFLYYTGYYDQAKR